MNLMLNIRKYFFIQRVVDYWFARGDSKQYTSLNRFKIGLKSSQTLQYMTKDEGGMSGRSGNCTQCKQILRTTF